LKLIYEGVVTLHAREDGRKVVLANPQNMDVSTCQALAVYFTALTALHANEGWDHAMRSIIAAAEKIRREKEVLPIKPIDYKSDNWPGW
jgi:hypothetical protein